MKIESNKMERAMFAAGCFWGVEDAFTQLPGVTSTTVGYSGGHTKNPSYREVCTDRTGHAEVVLVEYDPTRVSYRHLADHFFTMHDPTTLNRQGPDEGTQYRSAIFCFSPEQEKDAREALLEAQKRFSKEVVTEIKQAGEFYRAEDYHQKYHQKHGGHCNV